MSEVGFRQQILTTLALIPITFGLWFAAGILVATPATWLANQLLSLLLPDVIASSSLDDSGIWMVVTQFGEINGNIVSASEAGYGIATQINTRLVSYSIPFYAALLWGSRIGDPVGKFALGLFGLWVMMALGLIAITAKDLMLILGTPFLEAPGIPPAAVIAVGYQFSVLLVPTLAPVAIWVWQLRGTPLWQQLSDQLERSRKIA